MNAGKNTIIECSDYYEILLFNKNKEVIAKTKISKEQLILCDDRRWHLNKRTGYVEGWGKIDGKETTLILHRILTNCPKGFEVDHINGDRLDNRKVNLRICKRQENALNKKAQKSKSGIPGVRWFEDRQKWQVVIKKSRKRYFLGYFNTKEEAIIIRKEAEKQFFGKFARGVEI